VFVDDDGPDGVAGTEDDDLRLSSGSSCVDTGNNDTPFLPAWDFAGQPRVQLCRVDIGAYESAMFVDCNANGLSDACEAVDNPDGDCNGNLILDQCEPDCNGNGFPDDCDLAEATSDDCDFNGLPDECDPDCDGDEIPDVCDIIFGPDTDCNGNTIPDECELSSPVGAGFVYSHTINSPPEAKSDVQVVLYGQADLAASSEFFIVELNGNVVGAVFQSVGSDCTGGVDLDYFVVSRSVFNEFADEGDVVVTIAATDDVDPEGCAFNTLMRALVMYDASTGLDCDENGVPDDCQEDSDGDDVIDACDGCPNDITKIAPGVCGCGVPDADTDDDGVEDCIDQCSGLDDTIDDDGNGVPDCVEAIPAVSQWGLVIMALLLLTSGTVHVPRRR
jgi:hypothetical protein